MKGLTLDDLLRWAAEQRRYAADERERAVWSRVVRQVEECLRTYRGERDGSTFNSWTRPAGGE